MFLQHLKESYILRRHLAVWDALSMGGFSLLYSVELFPAATGEGGATALALCPKQTHVVVASAQGDLGITLGL